MTTLHPFVKILIIGLYIGVLGQALAPFAGMLLYYLPFSVPFTFPVASIGSVVVAFFIEELIRRAKYSRRTKIMLACGVAALAVLAYVVFLAWTFRWFGL